MRLLVIYSPDRKGEFVSLIPLLMERSIAMTPLELDWNWTPLTGPFLLETLEQHPYAVFLVSPEDFATPFFCYTSAYSIARHEKTYLWNGGGTKYPHYWNDRFQTFTSFKDFVGGLWEEGKRYALRKSQTLAKKSLEDRGRDVSVLSLVETVEDGDITSLDLFMKAGFSPDTFSRKGVPLLSLAVRKNHAGAVKVLIQAGGNPNIISQDRNNTPLMDAAIEGNLEIIRVLLDLGVNLDVASQDGQTALTLAMGKSSPDVALALLEKGANPYIEDKLGMSAYKYAALFGRKEILDRLDLQNKGKK